MTDTDERNFVKKREQKADEKANNQLIDPVLKHDQGELSYKTPQDYNDLENICAKPQT